MTKTLYIHAGQFKTGSSYLQSCFALSTDVLAENGIAYPWVSNLDRAKAGRITSGNGTLLLDGSAEWDALDRSQFHENTRGFLFSNEYFCVKTFHPDVLERIQKFCSEFGIDRVHCILFVRNPLDHAISTHQQMIKRSGSDMDLDSYVATYKMPIQIMEFLRQAEENDFDVTLYNYSMVSKEIAALTEDWLEIPAGSLQQPEIERINRSLSKGELELQKQLNRHIGQASRFADALCEELPKIRPEFTYPSLQAQSELFERLAPAIDYINERLPEGQAYSTTPQVEDTQEQDQFVFSRAQLETIATAFGRLVRDTDIARKKAEQTIAKERAIANYHIATLRLARGNNDEAETFFRKSLDADPDYLPAVRAFVNFLLDAQDKLDEARTLLAYLSKADPDGKATQELTQKLEKTIA